MKKMYFFISVLLIVFIANSSFPQIVNIGSKNNQGIISQEKHGDEMSITHFSFTNKSTISDGVMVLSLPYSASFETDFAGWEQSLDDDYNWSRNSGSTGSTGTGASSAYDGNYYLYTESSSPAYPYKEFGLYSLFTFENVGNPYMSFWYHMYGVDMGELKVQVSTDGGAIWNNEWILSGDQGNQWIQAEIDLSSYANNTSVLIRFWGTTGSGYTSDMAIDLVDIYNNYDAPYNLSHILNSTTGEVTLDWDFDGGKIFQNFNIYRNSTFIGTSVESNFMDSLPAYGTYEYFVKALVDEVESDPSNSDMVSWEYVDYSVNPMYLTADLATGDSITQLMSINDLGGVGLNYSVVIDYTTKKKGSKDISLNYIGKAGNIYYALLEEQQTLTYDASSNLMQMIHRADPATYPVNDNGAIVSSQSIDNGNTWTYKMLTVGDGTNNTRYPQGYIYNIENSIDPNSVIIGATAPSHTGGSWNKNIFASGVNSSSFSSIKSFINMNCSFESARYGTAVTDNGYVYALATCTEDDGSSYTQFDLNIYRGIKSVSHIDFGNNYFSSIDALAPTKYWYGDIGTAWSQDGSIGYVFGIGLLNDFVNQSAYNPIVWKSTDAGANWQLIVTGMNMVDFSGLENVLSMSNDGHYIPLFMGGVTGTVDANGDLQFFGECYSGSTLDVNSCNNPLIGDDNVRLLNVTINANSGIIGFNYLTNFLSSKVSNNSSYAYAPGADGVGWNHRMQASRSDDGLVYFVVYGDTENADVLYNGENAHPDLYIWGSGCNTTNTNPPIKMTSDGTFWFHYVSDKAISLGNDSYQIPVSTTVTHVEMLTNTDLDPVTINFVDGLEYTIPNLSPGWLSVNPEFGTIVGNGSAYVDVKFNATGLDPGTYQANLNVSNSGKAQITVPVTLNVLHPISVDATAFLEGPFFSNQMNNLLKLYDYLPLTQSYNTAPWNYAGTESVAAIPNNDVVDWVLVEVRETSGDASTATSGTVIGRRAGFILKDGSIVDTDGSSALTFSTVASQNVFAVIYHRNHIPIMSANPLSSSGNVYTINFSTADTQVYGGASACKEVTSGVWGMLSGNALQDNQVDNKDKNDVWEVEKGNAGYYNGDMNMNGQVDTSDEQVNWENNAGKSSKVPE